MRVAPDEVDISAGVETRDAQLDTATRQNDERVASVLAFLKKAGVPDKDIQSDAIQVQPDYGPGDWSIETRFYRVRKGIEVRLTTATNLENVVTGLLKNGANSLCSVSFRTTKLRKYRDQARLMATRAAKEKARALCEELGVKCGKPASINAQDFGGDFSWYGSGWGPMRNAGFFANSVQNVTQGDGQNPGSEAGTMALGQISVSATVNVSFGIE